jgi:hypothetical protein
MTDEAPMNLQVLDPGDPPDQVRPAVRRFRWRVVAFTILCVVGVAILSVWGAVAVVHHRNAFTLENSMDPAHLAITRDLTGICHTPSYMLGGIQVALIDTAPMPGGGVALHFILHGQGLSEQRKMLGGGSARRSTTLISTADGARPGFAYTQVGETWAEAYVQAPMPAEGQLQMRLMSPALGHPQGFSIDLAKTDC